jgi:hypothetical protein
MKLRSMVWAALAMMSLAISISVQAAEPRVRFWAEVPFVSSGNFLEFTATMSKTRDQARKELLDEFGSLYLPSVMSGADAASAAKAIAKVMITFDRMCEEHVEYANRGIPEALERHLLAYFDQYYRDLGLTDEERRGEFVRVKGWSEAMTKARRGQLPSPERDKLFLEVFRGVDYLLYGSYTVIAGGSVSLTLTAEKYKTGETRNFQASGEIQQAVAALSRELFNFVQENARKPWKNPLESLEWILPPPNLPTTQLPREIKLFCEGQDARVPYARELVLAAQGGNYRRGGIPAIRDRDIFLVADVQRTVENHFYFGSAYTGEDPRGPVRTQAGFGTIRPNFVCVKGAVAEPVRWEQDIYRAIRKAATLPAAKKTRVEDALEFLLIRLDAYGTRSWFENKFQTAGQAIQVLEKDGILVSDALRTKLDQLE